MTDINDILKKKKEVQPQSVPKSIGYHLEDIPKGVVGEPSKILEETLEFMDAIKQGVDLMALVELSDLYGAIEAFLQDYHPSVTMESLKNMSAVTKRAFKSGRRT